MDTCHQQPLHAALDTYAVLRNNADRVFNRLLYLVVVPVCKPLGEPPAPHKQHRWCWV